MNDAAVTDGAVKVRKRRGGSLTRRMIVVSAIWISVLLLIGGFALDRVLSRQIIENFDSQLERVLKSMIGASEIGPDGEVRFSRPPADQRFLEPYSGSYWQVSGEGFETFPSRSLWDRLLRTDQRHNDKGVHFYDSSEFPDEKLRIVERDLKLPGSSVRWRFQVAQSRDVLDAQIAALRRTLVRSFLLLGAGLIAMAAIVGFWFAIRPRNPQFGPRSGRNRE